MAAIISSNFRSLNAAAFVEDVTGDKTNIYIGLGKSSPWGGTDTTNLVDATAPTPQDTLDAINEARQQLIGMKLVAGSDVSHVVPRHDWVAGAEFVAWDSTDVAIFDKAFYCLTPDFKVYKCIAAPASGGVSDVPTHTGAAVTKTNDNYYWKYMYTILATDSEKFLTNSFMPVKTVTEQTKSVGTTTSSSAIITLTEANPFIQVGQIVSGTSSSVTASQTVTAISGKTITLSANANAAVAGATFTFGNFASDNPLFSQQQSQITSRALGTAQGIERLKLISGGSSYPNDASGVTIAITGDGTGADIPSSATINAAYISGGAFVSDIIITGSNASSGTDVEGTNYSVAQATVASSGTGSGAVFEPIIAPRGRPGFSTSSAFGGHGVDPVFELGGFFVAINVQISGTTDTAIANTQDFRQISLIKNPLISGEVATSPASAINTLKYIKYGNSGTAYDSKASTLATAVQTADHVIENTSTGFKGYIVNVDTTNKKIYYFQNDLTGYVPPTDADMVVKTGGSAVSAVALTASSDDLSIHDADGNFSEGSGEFLFLENRDPIQRSTSQIEDVKLIIEF